MSTLPPKTLVGGVPDMAVLYDHAEGMVDNVLPGARYRSLVISTRCGDLLTLKGQIIFRFLRLRLKIPRFEVVEAVVTVDVPQQTIATRVADVSHLSVETATYVYPGKEAIARVAAAAHEHIATRDIEGCDVTLSHQGDRWAVRCGPLGNFVSTCNFDVIDDRVTNVTR